MKLKVRAKIFRFVIITSICLIVNSVIKGEEYSITDEQVRCLLDSARKYTKDAPDISILFADSLIKTLGNTYALQKAEALRFRSIANKQKRHYKEAIADCYTSLKIEEENNNPKGQIATFNLLGNTYKVQKKYDIAVKFYVKSLKIGESLYPDAQETSDTYSKLGSTFSVRKKFDEAHEYFNKALIIRKKAFEALSNPKEDKRVTRMLAATYQDLGNMYLRMDSFDIALDYYKNSSQLNEAIGNYHALGKTYSNIGIIHQKKGEYQKAVENYQRSLVIKEKFSDKRGIATTNTNLCELYCELGDYENALPYCNKSIEYAKLVKDYEVLGNTSVGKYHF